MPGSNALWILAAFWLQTGAPGKADLVLRGGKVITVDARGTIASAVAVRGNRIAAVGTEMTVVDGKIAFRR